MRLFGRGQKPDQDQPVQCVFFMHIAKTAGSLVNKALSDAYGKSFVDHCETPHRIPRKGVAYPHIKVWSGHVYLRRWLNIEKRQGFDCTRVTLVREPIRQLASHMQWLDHYNQPESKREFRALHPEAQKVVRDLAATDLENAEDLDRYLANLQGRGIQFFDNCQSRYFLFGFCGIDRQTPIKPEHKTALEDAMRRFAVIGCHDDLTAFQAALSETLDRPVTFKRTKVNAAKSVRRIPVENADIAAVLGKRVKLDSWLYDRIKEHA